jgi:hypothetical protein
MMRGLAVGFIDASAQSMSPPPDPCLFRLAAMPSAAACAILGG